VEGTEVSQYLGDLHNAQKATSKIREAERMKKLLVLLALLLIVGCAGHLASFSGSMDNPPDYYTYAGEGYGYPQIWPIGADGF
jgi:ferric-dicitrate binding protein FerR (iron transport regulator)